MRQAARNRSRQEIICDILSIVELGGVTKTKVMYRASLSYAQLKSYESYLQSNKLIEISKADDIWILTDKGKQYLEACKLVEQIVERAPEPSRSFPANPEAVTAAPNMFNAH